MDIPAEIVEDVNPCSGPGIKTPGVVATYVEKKGGRGPVRACDDDVGGAAEKAVENGGSKEAVGEGSKQCKGTVMG